jgi:mono/diheme cytochrome c family protein
MKAFASAVFLFTLAAVASSAQTSRSIWDGVFTDSQATRGDTLYRASCASCHGTDLNGGEMAPALRGGTFTSNWNDLALSELMDRIYQTMPANAPQSLSRTQSVDILAFLLRSGGFPTGGLELSPDAANLQQVKFLASNP